MAAGSMRTQQEAAGAMPVTISVWLRWVLWLRQHILPRGGVRRDSRIPETYSSFMVSSGIARHERISPVIRKENRMDSFQRQVSALRQQLSSDSDEDVVDDAEPMPSNGEFERPVPPIPISMLDRVSPDTHTQWLGGDPDVGVIASGSRWNGTMHSDGSIRIHGHAEGDLFAARGMYVAEGATVSAKISSNNIVIAGTVDGTVDCTGRLEILPTGRVSGDVSAPTLVVHDGATMTGQLKMRTPAGEGA